LFFVVTIVSDRVHCWLNVHFNRNLLQFTFCIYIFSACLHNYILILVVPS